MRYYDLLREYSRDKTVQNWGKKIAARVEQDRTLSSNFKDIKEPEQIAKFVADFIIKPLEQADPTKNKQYVQNLIKFYIAGEQLEDLTSTAVEYLTKFHKLKAKKMIPSPRNDINRYANFGDFASVIDEYPDPEEKESMPKGAAKVVYKDANVRIINPEDKEAACYYGQGTRWCTAATKGNNMFDQYNTSGPLYILIPTKQKYKGEKYQIAPWSYSYMDEQDGVVKVPELKERFGSPGFLKWWANIHKDVPMSVEHFVQLDKDNEKILRSAMQSIAEYTEKLINYYLDLDEIDEDEAYRLRRAVIKQGEMDIVDVLHSSGVHGDGQWPITKLANAFFYIVPSDVDWMDDENNQAEIAEIASGIKTEYNSETDDIDIEYPSMG
jgi:hypothetical protein